MEEKITAVYLLAWQSELTPEDRGSYERLLAEQKRACLELLEKRGIDPVSGVTVYTSRKELFMDIDRDRVARLVVSDRARLSAIQEELDAILFELRMRGIEVLTVDGNG
ncbi:MAG: recombinase family protein [Syntrophobacter sp.]